MIRLMDCTLRDGANVVGKGFDGETTEMVLNGLVANGIQTIEYGNALGLGAYAKGATPALSDADYLKIGKRYADKCELGMFLGWKNAEKEKIQAAKDAGLSFLRVGANAGDGEAACDAVRMVKNAGLVCRYSQMKAYVFSPDALAREAALLEKAGADEIAVMDSAGTMLPKAASAYVRALKSTVSIPVSFHGHNNLGMAAANALATHEAGADMLDCCLMGMARSAGNIPTELAATLLQSLGEPCEINLPGLLAFLDGTLIPHMAKLGFQPALSPIDMVLGAAGAHSSYLPLFKSIAAKHNVNLYALITAVSKQDRAHPGEELMNEISQALQHH